MAKNVESIISMTKGNGNTAVAEVMKDGKVDVAIINPDQNVTVIRHYDTVSDMVDAMNALGYNKVMQFKY